MDVFFCITTMSKEHQNLTLTDVTNIYNAWSSLYDITFGIISEPGRRELGKIVKKVSPNNLLEVGVGTGLLLPHYPTECQVIGVDASISMLEVAKKRASKLEHKHIELVHSDAEHLLYPDGSFECIVVAYVLSVTPNPALLIQELRRVCKKDGTILILNHFSGDNFWRWSELLAKNFADKIGFRSDFSYQEHIEKHDWKVERVKSVNLFNLSKLITIKNEVEN